MRLKAYLVRNKISVEAFTRTIGLAHRSTVYRYLRGEKIPGPAIMAAIYLNTRGEVQPGDFYDLPEIAGPDGEGKASEADVPIVGA